MKLRKLKAVTLSYFLTFASFIALVQGVINGNMTVTPAVIKANALYSFTIDSSTRIPAGGYFTLTFPPEVILNSRPQCKQIFGFQGGTPVCSANGNVLTYSGGFSTLNGIRFTVSPIVNPGSAQNVQNFVFRFFSTATSTTPIDQSTTTAFFFQYETDTLISAIIQPGSWQVGAITNWELSISPKNEIPAGGIVRFFMPKWIIQALHSISAQSMLQSGANTCQAKVNSATSWTSVPCQFVVDPIATNKDTLIITGAFTASTSSSFDLQISNVRNMPTTRPYSDFEVWTYDANSFGIDNMRSIEISMSQPGILDTSLVSVLIDAPSTVDAVTSYLFTLFIKNPVPRGGKIRIRIPSTIGPQYLTSVKAEQRINTNVKVRVVDASDPYYVELYDGYPTVFDSVPIAGLIAFRLQYLKNPPTSIPTASFEIETYDSEYIIEKITTGLIVVGSSGKITMNSNSMSENRVLEYNSFNFDMTLKNALQPGSTIEVKFPNDFIMPDVPAGTCRLIGISGLDSASSCTIVSNKMIIQNPFGSTLSMGGERIKFTIANNYIQNPTATRALSSQITVKTLTPSGNTVDDWTWTSRITFAENLLSSVTVTPSSNVAGDFPVTYTFRIRTPYLVEANAQIYVKFPTGHVSIYDTSTAQERCLALSTLSQTNMRCSARTTELTITRAFPSGICACQGEIAFSVGGVINPRSLKPSDTFQIQIMASDNAQIYGKRTGITVTMTQPNTKTTVSISLQNGQNGARDNYIFAVRNNNLKQDGDYMVIQAPSEVTLSNTTTCGARFGVRGFTRCVFERPNKMTVQFVFAGRRALGDVAINQGFEFMLTNIINPPSMSPSSQFQISTFTLENYNISRVVNGPTVSTRRASNMTLVLIRPSVYADGKWTNLTFSIIPNNYMQYMTMTIQVPQDVLIAQAVPNLCQVISTYSISREMVCDYIASSRTIRILNAFQVLTKAQYDSSSFILKQLQFMIGQFINPVGAKYSGDFVFTTFDRSGFIIDQQRANISYICSPSCGSCSPEDYTRCTSCNNASVFRFLYFGQCVQSCPDGTTIANNRCLTCPNGCSECSSVNDTCEVCNRGLFYLEGACVANCPDGYIEEAPAKCVRPEVPVYTFTSLFQKTEDYQCFMFPFSGATILVSLILWIATCCSKRLIEKERQLILQNSKRKHEAPFLNPLRLIEVCIAMISLIELAGWVFFLYCMINIQEKLPFYVICGALGFNLLLNFIMTCGIMRSKENYDVYVQKYSETYSCTYYAIKAFSLFISHKGFYLSFARYYRNRNRQSHLDFSYFDSGDEDGVSGACFKFFFLTSVLLLHGTVIAACVLNYMTNDLSKKLFCLDLDIIGMTTFQALLVLLTLLQCGRGDSSVAPEDDINNQLAYQGYDEEQERPKEKKIIKKKVKDKNGKIVEVEEVIEVSEINEDGDGPKGKPSKKFPGKGGPNSKNRLIEEDPDYTRHGDRTIDPMDYEDDGRRIDNGFDGKQRRKHVHDQEEDDFAEEIVSGRRRPKRRPKQDINDYDEEDYDPEDDSFDEEGNPSPRTKKNRQQRRKRRQKIEQGLDPDDEDEEEDDVFGNRKPGKKTKKKKRAKKILKDGTVIEETIEEEEDEDDDYDPGMLSKKPKKKSKKKKKVKKTLKDGRVVEEEVDETVQDEDDDEEEEGNENRQKKKPKKKKKKVKKTLKDGSVIEEDVEETVEEDESEDDADDAGSKQKKPKKKSKKKKVKKTLKDGRVVEEEVEETEEDDDDEEQDPKVRKKPKKKKVVKKKLPNGQVVEELESISEQEDEDDDKREDNKSPNKKKKKKKGDTTIERVSHNASSAGDEDIFGEQQAPHFERVKVDQEMNKFDQQLIADVDEPSYRELVDQINHMTTDNRAPTGDQQLVDRSRSPKKGNYIQLNQESQSKDEIQNNLRVSAKYGTINQSIPTQFDEQFIDGQDYHEELNPQFSQEDQLLLLNQGSSKHQLSKNDSQFSKVNFKDSQTHLQQVEDLDQQNKNISPSGAKSQNQLSPLKPGGSSILPSQDNYEIMKTKEGFKTPTMSMENHAPEELRSQSQTNGGLTPGKRSQIKVSTNNRNPTQIEHQDTPEIEDEELKDQVNKDDIKPKTKILFSDKSESSVEDLMEDTPSNYNVMNGRLDEDSRGLRSIQYKALSKKILYQKNLERQHQAISGGDEDQEARRIGSKGTDIRPQSQVEPPSTSSSLKMRRRERAMLFIKKAEDTGLIVNQGNTLLEQQKMLTQNINRQYRNASIGDIPSDKLIEDHEDDGIIYKNASQIIQK